MEHNSIYPYTLRKIEQQNRLLRTLIIDKMKNRCLLHIYFGSDIVINTLFCYNFDNKLDYFVVPILFIIRFEKSLLEK